MVTPSTGCVASGKVTHTRAPTGGVKVSVCFASSSWPSVHEVVSGAHVGPVEHFTAACRALVSSVIVYSTPGSIFHWMPQEIDPLASVQPYFTVSGRAYSKCAGPVQSLLHVPVPSRSPHTRARTVSPFRVICVDSVPTALSVSCARAWNVPDTSCFAAHASGTSVTVQVSVD